ncbi:hypothetical protein SLS54_004349 [Diplodia seriata]
MGASFDSENMATTLAPPLSLVALGVATDDNRAIETQPKLQPWRHIELMQQPSMEEIHHEFEKGDMFTAFGNRWGMDDEDEDTVWLWDDN